MAAANLDSRQRSQMYRNTGIKSSCTDQALLNLMGQLEIEMSARAMENDQERRRRGQANNASASASTHATAAAEGKGKGKSKGKKSTTVCQDYMTDRGCPKGDQCTFLHPRKPGKCLRCGGVNHDLSTCCRPGRDAKLNPPNSAKASGRGNPPPAPKKGRGKGGRGGTTETQPKNTQKGERMQSGHARKLWKTIQKVNPAGPVLAWPYHTRPCRLQRYGLHILYDISSYFPRCLHRRICGGSPRKPTYFGRRCRSLPHASLLARRGGM